MIIYYDSYQEGKWFQNLHEELRHCELKPFPSLNEGPPLLNKALSIDRPDIVLTDGEKPILVVERTVEVPSGHNVGQRYGRLVAAAQMRIPAVYFGPYAAYKHGGNTQGPRYANLRLFYALQKMANIENTAITTINWPVNENYEVIKTSAKDNRIKEYLNLFFPLYRSYGFDDLPSHIMSSQFEKNQESERREFIRQEVSRPEQYDGPPTSVKIAELTSIPKLTGARRINLTTKEVVIYTIGMTYVRSDPYTGMALLYAYLYCNGMANRNRQLVLDIPNISQETWNKAASNPRRKDIRVYKMAADGILFADAYCERKQL